MPATHILDGVCVVDLTQFIAGPIATRTMAEMGAEVIKVELPPSGEVGRALPVIKNGRSAYYLQQNRGKNRNMPIRGQDEHRHASPRFTCAQADFNAAKIP